MRRDPTGPGLVVTGVGTGVGKTTLTQGLARALVRRGLRVAALKPFETGVVANPEDAMALARACGRPELAHAPGLYRAGPPLAPLSVELAGGRACDPVAVADSVRSAAAGSDVTLVESAGGLAVPLTRTLLFADFAASLGWPLLLVARDELGVLSHVLAALEVARSRRLDVEVIALGLGSAPGDPSVETNARALRELVGPKVVRFLVASDDDEALATAAAPVLKELSLAGLLAEAGDDLSPSKDNRD
jgi:dethiobiotin synthetase